MSITTETEYLLDLMSRRTTSLLYRRLWNVLSIQDISGICGDQEKAAETVLSFLENSQFIQGIALRLPGEIHGLLWAEIARRLFATGECRLSYFGHFSRDQAHRVGFESDYPILNGIFPRLDVGGDRADNELAAKVCRKELSTCFSKLSEPQRTMPPSVISFATTVEMLLLCLDKLMASVGDITSDLAGEVRLRYCAHVAAHAAYYSYIVGFGKALAIGPSLEIATFGVFRLDYSSPAEKVFVGTEETDEVVDIDERDEDGRARSGRVEAMFTASEALTRLLVAAPIRTAGVGHKTMEAGA